MKYVYSATTNAFYPLALEASYRAADSWPETSVEVDDGIYSEFSDLPPEGKMRIAGADGFPVWIDIPAPSKEELIAIAEQKKERLMEDAQNAIGIWQTELQLGIISDEDKQSLTAWMMYIKALKAVDTSLAPDLVWPEPPAQ